MISIKVSLDDLTGTRVIRRKHQARENQRIFNRQRPYSKETIQRGKYDPPTPLSYTRINYNHGRSVEIREKCWNGQSDGKVYRRDYYHGSAATKINEPVSGKPENKCEFYRRGYFQPPREKSSPKENLFLQKGEDRARSFVDRPTAKANVVLRPSVLADTGKPRIREIVSLSSPVIVAGSSKSTGSDVPAEEREDNGSNRQRRSGKRVQSRKELALMRMRIARLSIQPKATAEAKPSPKPSPATSTIGTQTPKQEPLLFDYSGIIDIYRCEKCRSLCLPELYECGAGHAICEECWLGLTRCPGVHESSRNAGSFRRAFGLEKIAKLLQFPCRWQEHGCEERLDADDWRDHAARCRSLMGKKVSQPVPDSGLDSDDDVVVIMDDDDELEFQSGEE